MNKLLPFLALLAASFNLSITTIAQCPYFKGVLVDACNGTGSEGDNEFLILRNGNIPLDPPMLDIYYGVTLTGGVPSGTVNSSTIHFGGSGFSNTYTAAELAFIDNLNAANSCVPATPIFARPVSSSTVFSIPANAFVVVLQQPQTASYTWTGLCAQAQNQPVWILFEHNNNVFGSSSTYGNGFNTGGSGRFKNYGTSSANNARYFSIASAAYPGCTEAPTLRSYDYTQLPFFMGTHDGGSVGWDVSGAATYSNTGCNAPSVLPLYLIAFSGTPRNGMLQLSWRAECETSMQEHVIEKSSGGDFTALAHIPAANAGCGAPAQYTFTDAAFGSGAQLYRLKMVALSGDITYSSTLRFNRGTEQADGGIRLLENPVRRVLKICGMAQGAPYRVLDITGNILQTGNAGAAPVQCIMTDDLPNGFYFLQTGGGALKFVKE